MPVNAIRHLISGCLLAVASCASPALFAQSEGQAAASSTALPGFCTAGGTEPVIPAKASARLIRDGFVFVEGPVWVEALDAFLFSEMDFNAPGDQGPLSTIHRLALPEAFDVFITHSGSNGLAVDAQGLLAATHDDQAISRYDLQTKQRSRLVTDYAGKHFNSPNDLAMSSSGNLYFSDPDWQIGKRPNQTGVTGVYWRKPDGSIMQIEPGLDKPNGVTLSPDQTRLYVGSVDGVISVYPVSADGSVGARSEFARVDDPDGMTVDCAGNLYVASHGRGEVVVLSPAGERISTILAGPKTTNVAFGGHDRKVMLITAGAAVYRLDWVIPGFPY